MSEARQPESVAARSGQWTGSVAVVCSAPGNRVRVDVFKGDGVGIRLADSVDLPVDSGSVQSTIRRLRADQVVAVVPSGQSICRVVPLPEGVGGAEALSSLSLLAEAQLPSRVPDHRRAVGLFPSQTQSVSGLLTGWIPGRESTIERLSDHKWHWVSEPSCAAALAGIGSSGVVVVTDKHAGTITGAACGTGHGMVRSRVDTSGDASRIASLLHELVHGTDTAHTDIESLAQRAASGKSCVASSQTRSSIGRVFSGATIDDAWFEKHGVSAGAAIIALDARCEVSSLCAIRAEPVVEKLGTLDRVKASLSNPRSAWVAAVVCGLIALIAPLGFAYARTLVLEKQLEDASIPEDRFSSLSDEAAVYDHLRTARWPMTRLMSIVSRAAPVGITVSSIRLSPDVGLRVSGQAQSAALINDFVQNLNTSKVFERARSSSIDATDDRGIVFELSAQVGSDPHREVPKDFPDYAEETLAVRLYGEGASNTRWTGGGSSSSSGRTSNRTSSRPSRETLANAGNESRATTDRASERPERGGEAGVAPAPPALSEADISAMDNNTARAAFAARQGYIGQNRSTMDEETKQRLESEVNQLRDHLRALRGGE
ncbi:MAG: PilN domain-containing protein [Phycisphaeraceae bacterium]|nr:PilN domain-containing protein [Phycisphaerales bacterium]MCB9861409.1 PilN domain-containing protein [Phycisphaeraceae bacterium]